MLFYCDLANVDFLIVSTLFIWKYRILPIFSISIYGLFYIWTFQFYDHTLIIMRSGHYIISFIDIVRVVWRVRDECNLVCVVSFREYFSPAGQHFEFESTVHTITSNAGKHQYLSSLWSINYIDYSEFCWNNSYEWPQYLLLSCIWNFIHAIHKRYHTWKTVIWIVSSFMQMIDCVL